MNIDRVHTTALGPERFRNATGRPCSHLFHCVRSFRNKPTTSRCDRSGTVQERVRLSLWCERATGPVPEPFQLPVTFVDIQPILHISKRSSLHGIFTSHDQIWEKCPTALTSDDLNTPRAPVQITLFVAVLFIQRSPGAPQTLFHYHNPMIIISYMMSMCIQLK